MSVGIHITRGNHVASFFIPSLPRLPELRGGHPYSFIEIEGLVSAEMHLPRLLAVITAICATFEVKSSQISKTCHDCVGPSCGTFCVVPLPDIPTVCVTWMIIFIVFGACCCYHRYCNNKKKEEKKEEKKKKGKSHAVRHTDITRKSRRVTSDLL